MLSGKDWRLWEQDIAEYLIFEKFKIFIPKKLCQLLCYNLVSYVRREKALFFSRCKSRPATFAPAGSNWSSRGGNEAAEASSVEGP
jgi:hypothetical protein